MMAELMTFDTRNLDLAEHLQRLVVAYNSTQQAPRYCHHAWVCAVSLRYPCTLLAANADDQHEQHVI
jgi:hypothetical protein